MKIVINAHTGGFSLSDSAVALYQELTGELLECQGRLLCRDDPKLVAAVETLGFDANGDYANLKIVEVPDDVIWTINEYAGSEWIAEHHRTWG